MTQKKIYIVEDNSIIAETIKTILEKRNYSVVGLSNNVKKALIEIETLNPNLIIIDIKLKGSENGIELAEKINERFKIPFIFLTSLSDTLTLEKTKKTEPAGFIVKPFNEETLYANIEMSLFKYAQKKNIPSNKEFFFIKNKGKLIKIEENNIIYLKAFDNYCELFTPKEKYLVSKTLKSLQHKLSTTKFIRIHRSYIININKIDYLSENFVFISSQKIPIGKYFKNNLTEHIMLL